MRHIWLFLIPIVMLSSCGGVNNSSSINSTGSANPVARIETEKGVIVVELSNLTPKTTANFVKLAQAKFYDGLTFHRVEPGFVIQGGDPKGDGTGGSTESVPLEIACQDGTVVEGKVATDTCKVAISHAAKGVISMARTMDPNSATSQFFITLAPAGFLDRQYASFGHVTEGLEVLDKIEIGDKIKNIVIQ